LAVLRTSQRHINENTWRIEMTPKAEKNIHPMIKAVMRFKKKSAEQIIRDGYANYGVPLDNDQRHTLLLEVLYESKITILLKQYCIQTLMEYQSHTHEPSWEAQGDEDG